MSIIGIIPARFASTRFPGKPLVEIKGKSMIQRVFEQTKKSNLLNKIIIATDDNRIAEHVKSFGAEAILTKAEHPSGTDRCYEAYQLLGQTFDYVLNIQGDEPFLDPEQINSLAKVCNGDVEIATQMIKCTDNDVLFDKGEVKIVLSQNKEALYFSRNVIPHIKGKDEKEWHKHFDYYRHVGMYVYRTDILEKITKLKPSALELAESLEQLRWLENGYKINCVDTTYDSHCIDTPEDIEKVLRLMNIQ
ncbi:MAG: 3-deoxy-manno-octulosonate cytidylyltransferase [Bacteroidota bacterium]|nr:3-deoxy-manno-octulosonate cytidylyltransferase [Bacteroidota bacterium]MDP3144093.1 3-deoxy-manno-octulosonate cytidylyltransferase [Bacteroidota bacterium]